MACVQIYGYCSSPTQVICTPILFTESNTKTLMGDCLGTYKQVKPPEIPMVNAFKD